MPVADCCASVLTETNEAANRQFVMSVFMKRFLIPGMEIDEIVYSFSSLSTCWQGDGASAGSAVEGQRQKYGYETACLATPQDRAARLNGTAYTDMSERQRRVRGVGN